MSNQSPFTKPLKRQTLAEQVVEALREAILAGDWQAGEALPTEPELSQHFGVSRAVVRDATRMLAAQGLVEAQHGRGVFVTQSQTEAFGEALLLALRRLGATVWDVEQFEQLLYPELFALAASEATDEELAAAQTAGEAYLTTFRRVTIDYWDYPATPPDQLQTLMADYQALIKAVFAATHNRLILLLAAPLLRLRSFRRWERGETMPEADIARETAYVDQMLQALRTRNPEETRALMRDLMALPPEAQTAMRQTTVGETPVIEVASTE